MQNWWSIACSSVAKISIKFVGTVRPCNKLPAVQGHYRSPPHIRMRVLFARLKHTKRLPAGMSQSDCRVCKQTSRSSRGTRVRESACAKRFDGSAVKRFKTIFAQSPPPLRGAPSRREPWERSSPRIRLLTIQENYTKSVGELHEAPASE
jgi:hypothetical protein